MKDFVGTEVKEGSKVVYLASLGINRGHEMRLGVVTELVEIGAYSMIKIKANSNKIISRYVEGKEFVVVES